MDEARTEALNPAQSALLDKYRHLLRAGFRGTYIHGLDACSDEEKQQLWEHYKARYLRHLCRP